MSFIVVTGGCGYVGSHVAKELKQAGYSTIVIDRNAYKNPHTHKWAGTLIDTDFDSPRAFQSMINLQPEAIIHCAANSLVGPSVKTPSVYYDNNVIATKKLLDFCVENKFNNFIFSSSSSVYGLNHVPPITEDSNTKPLTAYGKSKLITDMMLEDYATAYGLKSMSFRYFNACGADIDADLGQVKGATHLIARIMESIHYDEDFEIYGDDYNTPDGTAIRDYTHVSDIAKAHVLGVEKLIKQKKNTHEIINLGSGKGYSVLEIVNAIEEIFEEAIDYTVKPRRKGDPECVFASNKKAKKLLNWSPKHDIYDIINSANNWYSKGD